MWWTLICVGIFLVGDAIVESAVGSAIVFGDIVCNTMLGGVVLKCDMVEAIW